MTHLATLVPDVAMTVTFYSDHKHFAFAARHDTGASCYISPMLAEQAGLGRASAGRVLVGTLSANTDDHGGNATATTPWRVMSWAGPQPLPVQGAARDELEDMRHLIDQLKARIETALGRIA
jgi:hypothetical protein